MTEDASRTEFEKMREERQQQQLLDSRKRELLRKVCDDSALARLQNIRIANEDLYDQVVQLLAYLQQNGQLQGKVSEELLLKLLSKLKEQKPEGKITFRRK